MVALFILRIESLVHIYFSSRKRVERERRNYERYFFFYKCNLRRLGL